MSDDKLMSDDKEWTEKIRGEFDDWIIPSYFDGDESYKSSWTYEITWDGFLARARIDKAEIERLSRLLNAHEGFPTLIQGEFTSKLKEENSRLKTDNLNLRLILQKLQRDLDRDEHVNGFWMKDLFPEAQEIEKRDNLLSRIPEIFHLSEFHLHDGYEEWLADYDEVKNGK